MTIMIISASSVIVLFLCREYFNCVDDSVEIELTSKPAADKDTPDEQGSQSEKDAPSEGKPE